MALRSIKLTRIEVDIYSRTSELTAEGNIVCRLLLGVAAVSFLAAIIFNNIFLMIIACESSGRLSVADDHIPSSRFKRRDK